MQCRWVPSWTCVPHSLVLFFFYWLLWVTSWTCVLTVTSRARRSACIPDTCMYIEARPIWWTLSGEHKVSVGAASLTSTSFAGLFSLINRSSHLAVNFSEPLACENEVGLLARLGPGTEPLISSLPLDYFLLTTYYLSTYLLIYLSTYLLIYI